MRSSFHELVMLMRLLCPRVVTCRNCSCGAQIKLTSPHMDGIFALVFVVFPRDYKDVGVSWPPVIFILGWLWCLMLERPCEVMSQWHLVAKHLYWPVVTKLYSWMPRLVRHQLPAKKSAKIIKTSLSFFLSLSEGAEPSQKRQFVSTHHALCLRCSEGPPCLHCLFFHRCPLESEMQWTTHTDAFCLVCYRVWTFEYQQRRAC